MITQFQLSLKMAGEETLNLEEILLFLKENPDVLRRIVVQSPQILDELVTSEAISEEKFESWKVRRAMKSRKNRKSKSSGSGGAWNVITVSSYLFLSVPFCFRIQIYQ